MNKQQEQPKQPENDQSKGFEGQAGYDNQFADGVYHNPEVVDSGGTIDDRAGSYEKGYGVPDRQSDLEAQMPEHHPRSPSQTNYTTAPSSDNDATEAVKEE